MAKKKSERKKWITIFVIVLTAAILDYFIIDPVFAIDELALTIGALYSLTKVMKV